MEKTEKKLRANILTELKKLTPENSPELYKMIQNKKGYQEVEKTVIKNVLKNNLPPIAIIPQMEMEYSLSGLN